MDRIEKLLKEVEKRKEPSFPIGKSTHEDKHSPLEKKYLNKYARNLTSEWQDPAVGRELELAQLTMVLSKRKKANPILVGPAGTGKSQIVYELANTLADPNYSGPLKGKEIWEVSTSSIIAGASFVGMSEKRMQGILDEAMADPNVILFWDEIHSMVGAGAGNKSNNDLSQMVKPALAGGKISVIGATTNEEYEIIRAEKALNRRFNKIEVRPLTEPQVVEVLNGIKYLYERHHGIMYNSAAIRIMPILSQKYSGLYDPDAAIDLMDTAGAIKAGAPDRYGVKNGNKVLKKDVYIAAAMLYSESLEAIEQFMKNK